MLKSAHISIDDVTSVLQRLTIGAYESIYEDKLFKHLRLLHQICGLKITLYVYAKNKDWSLAEIPDTYRSEFVAASDWLKFGFHGVAEEQKHDNVLPDFKDQYGFVIREIERFAGDASVAQILRLHYWLYPIEYTTVLKENGVKTILCKPDSKTTEIDGIPVWNTDIRIERDKHIARRIWQNKRSNQPLVVFTHEWAMGKRNMLKLAIATFVIKLFGYNYICE